MAERPTGVNLPSASEFIEFAKKSKAINLDVSAATLLDSAEGILRHRPGYVLFNIRCGMLIIELEGFQFNAARGVQQG